MTEPAGSDRPHLLVQGDWLLKKLPDWQEEFELRPIDLRSEPEFTSRALVLLWDGSPLERDILDVLQSLKLIAGFTTGFAGVDLNYLRARGIALTNGAGVNAHDVADHATALIFALWHDLAAQDRAVRSGLWLDESNLRRSLRGHRIGIVGLGRIGLAIAQRMAPHGTEIAWWGPRPKPDLAYPRLESLSALAQWSDILVIAAPATADSARQIDGDVLDSLGPRGIVINVSRGALVDEDALIERLRDGRLAAAGLDVFCEEPVDTQRWRAVPNCLLTPHMAGATQDGLKDLLDQMRENVRCFFRGDPLLSPVTGPH